MFNRFWHYMITYWLLSEKEFLHLYNANKSKNLDWHSFPWCSWVCICCCYIRCISELKCFCKSCLLALQSVFFSFNSNSFFLTALTAWHLSNQISMVSFPLLPYLLFLQSSPSTLNLLVVWLTLSMAIFIDSSTLALSVSNFFIFSSLLLFYSDILSFSVISSMRLLKSVVSVKVLLLHSSSIFLVLYFTCISPGKSFTFMFMGAIQCWLCEDFSAEKHIILLHT